MNKEQKIELNKLLHNYYFGNNTDLKNDYPKFCHEHLFDEVKRLRKIGRTGVEAHISADSYVARLKENTNQ